MYKVTSGLKLDPIELKSDVIFLLGILDERVPEILNKVYLNVFDKNSSLKATELYDLNWFKKQRISTDGKIEVAKILKSRAEAYGVKSEIWDAIVRLQPEVLKAIDLLENRKG